MCQPKEAIDAQKAPLPAVSGFETKSIPNSMAAATAKMAAMHCFRREVAILKDSVPRNLSIVNLEAL